MAENYTVLEELGSKTTASPIYAQHLLIFVVAGGSFGVVYKAIDRTTGEFVAIKHVSLTTNFITHLVLTALLD